MTIIDDLLSSVRSTDPDYAVDDVLIGLHWTPVHSLYLGLAATQTESSCCFAEDISGAGHLHEKSAYELAEYLHSPRPLEASVGMAALNSILCADKQAMIELNARDLITERGRGKRVALVGRLLSPRWKRHV